jgi:hypothetical protein
MYDLPFVTLIHAEGSGPSISTISCEKRLDIVPVSVATMKANEALWEGEKGVQL